MSESVATQSQGSVLMSMIHITTREHGGVPGWGSSGRPCGCTGLYRTGCAALETLSYLSLVAVLGKAGSVPCPSSTMELALVALNVGEPA